MMEKTLWIVVEAFSFTARTTIGCMFFDYDGRRDFFGYTLEDTLRPADIKVYGETALPRGLICDVSLYDSVRLGKTIIFHTEDDKITIRNGVLVFKYALAHGGNTHADTEACVIVAKRIIDQDTVQGSLQDKLRIFIEQKIKEGYKIKAMFTYLPQTYNSILKYKLKKVIMTSQFWKGLLMAIVGVIVAAFSTTPFVLSVVIVTLIGTILVYLGTNAIIPLRPISIPSTLTGRDIIHALLILIGNAIISSTAMIVIEGKIDWLVMGKIVLSVTFTYLGSTLFAGPYSNREVSWTNKARLEYND